MLTNPSQLAIAIRYDPATMAAPIVVAKGAGVWAEHIRRAAAEAGVPALDRKRLARTLYRQVDPQQPIPPDQFAAVAEVLTQTGQLKSICDSISRSKLGPFQSADVAVP